MPRRSKAKAPKVAPGERVVETVEIPVPDEGRTITFIRPIDGDLRHSYDRTLPTERERRQELDVLETTCISCANTVNRADIKVCGRCQGARYCSKECQIQHWKVHKADCGEPGSPLPRLIERALADRFISFHLSLGIINLLGLAQTPRTREQTSAKTSEAIVCLTFELDFADIQELITRLSEVEFPPDVEGELEEERTARRTAAMAQHFTRCLSIKELKRVSSTEVPVEVCARHEEIQHVAASESLPSAAPATVTLLLLAADGSLGEGKVQAMAIPEASFMHIRLSNNTVSGHSTMFGPQTYTITPERTRDDMNNHIRMDKENKLRLRVKPKNRASA
ncbi:hypothetical protein C8R45DRAFT_1038906 [Mycena sanguinolenta]|nr:hypothetical protein C8R45DRAFT_1038906 [Mycena sanguinolenta]